MTTQIHVVSMSPMKQLALRYALAELYKKQVELILTNAVIQGGDKIDASLSRAENAFRLYDSIVAGLPTPNSMKHAKVKMLQLTVTGMQYLVRAVNEFDVDRFDEQSDYTDAVRREFPKLKALISSAAEFSYTVDEIRKGYRE